MGRGEKQSVYDDETLEKMKRYYRIDNDEDLLKYIKGNWLVGNNEGDEIPDAKND
jgi:hypothetical protein